MGLFFELPMYHAIDPNSTWRSRQRRRSSGKIFRTRIFRSPAKSRKVELMKIRTTREREVMGFVQVMPRESQGSDVIADGSKILIRKRPLFLLRIGG